MKMHIEFTAKETAAINTFSTKLGIDPIKPCKESHRSYTEKCEITETGAVISDSTVSEDFMVDLIGFVSEFADIFIGAYKSFKYFLKDAKLRFAKYHDPIWDTVIKDTFEDHKEAKLVMASKKYEKDIGEVWTSKFLAENELSTKAVIEMVNDAEVIEYHFGLKGQDMIIPMDLAEVLNFVK